MSNNRQSKKVAVEEKPEATSTNPVSVISLYFIYYILFAFNQVKSLLDAYLSGGEVCSPRVKIGTPVCFITIN
jgi:hypothetical protein